MSFEFILRIIGMIVLGIVGGYWGFEISKFNSRRCPTSPQWSLGWSAHWQALILTPYFTTRPARAMRSLLGRMAAESFIRRADRIGRWPVDRGTARLSAFAPARPFGKILPFIGVLVFSYFGVSLFVMRQGDIMGLVSALSGRNGEGGGSSSSWTNLNRTILLDTSVIIDGRVADIAKTGFLPGTLLIPRFVLNELQYIADSPDGLRRQRGRRGMEVLAELQKLPNILVRISDINVDGVREVDDKLVVLGKQLKSPVLTNDYNLNRIAELQGVTMLNINELANAVKSVVLPGEAMTHQHHPGRQGTRPGRGLHG